MRYVYICNKCSEIEKNQKDPLPGVAESVGFVHGVLAAL